ncbi:MAG: Holliday junction branch migration DNA helicase RuvB [bacterium]|nr:Holliday junction branch migration DNA helicase RuvB [bacterium]
MSSTHYEDSFLDSSLRPSGWEEYVGQSAIKNNLSILLKAAKERNHPPEHLLFYGPPGLGKTTLAHLIAKEMGASLKSTSGPTIEKVGDLAAIITNLAPGDVLFIDEIHRLNKAVEEVLYPAMEAGSLNIILGKGPGARVIELTLPPFTLIAATTRVALLSSPLRSRFSGGTFKLDFYTEEEISKIISRSATILNIAVTPEGLMEIAKRSRFTPRIANHLLKRCRDLAQVKKEGITPNNVREAINLLGIDQVGLTKNDRAVLEALIDKFAGGPVGLSTLATATHEEEATVEEVYEPYLIQLGFLERTPRGRVATAKAYFHLNRELPKDKQGSLL